MDPGTDHARAAVSKPLELSKEAFCVFFCMIIVCYIATTSYPLSNCLCCVLILALLLLFEVEKTRVTPLSAERSPRSSCLSPTPTHLPHARLTRSARRRVNTGSSRTRRARGSLSLSLLLLSSSGELNSVPALSSTRLSIARPIQRIRTRTGKARFGSGLVPGRAWLDQSYSTTGRIGLDVTCCKAVERGRDEGDVRVVCKCGRTSRT